MVETSTEFTPDFISPPGETIQDLLDEKSMSQAELAERMGRPVKTVNEIIKGKAGITPETSLQLERVLGVPSSFWLVREQRYRERLARAKESKELQQHVQWMRTTFPLKQMCDLGWIQGYSRRRDEQVDLLRNVLQFFGTATPHQWESIWLKSSSRASFRKSLKYESRPGAVSAWLRKGEIDAMQIDCRQYQRNRFEAVLGEIRTLTTSRLEDAIDRTAQLCADSGVAFVLTPQVRGARVSGATRWLDARKALIQLSLRYKSDDQFWFTFFHEAGHLILHGKRQVFLEGIEDPQQEEQEAEADRFAADFLIPSEKYDTFVESNTFTEDSVRRFAKDVTVAPGIVVGRLQYDKHIPHSHLNSLKKTFAWELLIDQ